MREVVGTEAPSAHAVAGAVVAVPAAVLLQLGHVLIVDVAQAEGAEVAPALVGGRVLLVEVLVEVGEEGFEVGGELVAVMGVECVAVHIQIKQLGIELLVILLKKPQVKVIHTTILRHHLLLHSYSSHRQQPILLL